MDLACLLCTAGRRIKKWTWYEDIKWNIAWHMFPSLAPAVHTDLFGNVFIKGGRSCWALKCFSCFTWSAHKLPSNHPNTQQIHRRLTERLRLSWRRISGEIHFYYQPPLKILNVSVVNSDWHNCTAVRGPNLTETIRTDALMNMNEHVEFNLSCWTVIEEEGVRRKMVQFFKSVLIGMHPKERKSSGILCIHLWNQLSAR